MRQLQHGVGATSVYVVKAMTRIVFSDNIAPDYDDIGQGNCRSDQGEYDRATEVLPVENVGN